MNLTVGMSKTDPIPTNALLTSWLPPLPAVHSAAQQSPSTAHSLLPFLFHPNLLCKRGRRIPAEYCVMALGASPLGYYFWFHLFFGLNNAFGVVLTTIHIIQTQNTQTYFCTFQSLILKFIYVFNPEYPDYQYSCFNAAVTQIAFLSGFLEYS